MGGLGFRVPCMIISPYDRSGSGSQGGYISHTQYEFGSILRYIEDNWNLGRLRTRRTNAQRASATSSTTHRIHDSSRRFRHNMMPNTFKPMRASRSTAIPSSAIVKAFPSIIARLAATFCALRRRGGLLAQRAVAAGSSAGSKLRRHDSTRRARRSSTSSSSSKRTAASTISLLPFPAPTARRAER